jgi:hypothetical protein
MTTFAGLNTRETALVIWIGGALVFSLMRPTIRAAGSNLLKVLFGTPALAAALFGAVAYVGLGGYLLWETGYWDVSMTKTAIFWFFGIALASIFNIKHINRKYFRNLIVGNFAFVAIVEYLDSLRTFPLAIELLFLPTILLLVGCQAIGDTRPEYALAKKLVDNLLAIAGLATLIFALTGIVADFRNILTIEHAKDFLLPVILTMWFLPYVYLIHYIVKMQSSLHMLHFWLRDDEQLFRFTKLQILRICGLNLARAQLFHEEFGGRLWGIKTKLDALQVIVDFRNTCLMRHGPFNTDQAPSRDA